MTFRRRLTVAVLWVSLGLLSLAGAIVYAGTQAALRRNLDASLLSIARAELASALDGPGGSVHVHDEAPVALSASTSAGYEKFALIRNESGEVVARTRNVAHTPVLALESEREARAWRGQSSFGDIRYGDETLRALYYPFSDRKGRRYVTVCAISQQPLRDARRAIVTTLVSALVACALAALLAARLLAQRLTEPLRNIERQARSIEESRLFERLPSVSGDAELAAVTDALNGMLARLESSFGRQQRFLMDASHELRTPLANLRGTLEVVLRRERDADEYRATLTACLPEVERLGALVGDLLALSRAEQGRAALQMATVDLAALAETSIAAHASRAERNGVRLVRRGVETALVRGDSLRVRQILDNLLDNALRHAPPQTEVVVEIRPDGFDVGDSGAGIAADDVPHVFERFWRGDPSRSRETGGLGLGLSIVHALTEAHGGRVDVHSVPGAGATFRVRLTPWES